MTSMFLRWRLRQSRNGLGGRRKQDRGQEEIVPWLKIDDGFPEHERIIGLPGPAAKWLHVVALCHCAKHLTDGEVEPLRLKVICAIAEVPRPTFQINQLVASGLWTDNEDGSFTIRDFLDYNPRAADVKAKRAAAKDRMRTVREGVRRSLKAAS